ncbi:hypothetical protein [Microbulbifer taiwanensis]|uniref:hypothetical protein n=1 Tax=Microbulbifer taiwanensis TaxID=986746 RepID=UPI0036233577
MLRNCCLAILIALFIASSQALAISLEPREQTEIIHTSADLIEARYVDAEKAREIAAALRRSSDRWRETREGDTFAKEVTELLREVSGDGHLGLSYSAEPIPEQQGRKSFPPSKCSAGTGRKSTTVSRKSSASPVTSCCSICASSRRRPWPAMSSPRQ